MLDRVFTSMVSANGSLRLLINFFFEIGESKNWFLTLSISRVLGCPEQERTCTVGTS